jgi:hypothetical protein
MTVEPSRGSSEVTVAANLVRAVLMWAAQSHTSIPTKVVLHFESGDRLSLVVPRAALTPPDYQTCPETVIDRPPAGGDEPFVPAGLQRRILKAIGASEERCLTGDGLAVILKIERTSLYYGRRKKGGPANPGGIEELLEVGWLKNHKRLGYYSPADLPPELQQDEDE